VDYSFEFDCPLPVERIPMDSLAAISGSRGALLFAPASFADSLARRGLAASPVVQFPNFHVSQLTGEFLNARTRPAVLTPWALMRISR
jgi:hypothetical protein